MPPISTSIRELSRAIRRKGLVGPEGPEGPEGDQGDPGADGSKVIFGFSAPSVSNPQDEGTIFLVVDAKGVVTATYQWFLGDWLKIGDINDALHTFNVSPVTSQGGSITSGSGFGFYRLLGNKLIFVRGFINITDRGTATGFMTFPLPAGFTVVAQGGVGSCRESSVGNLCDIQFMANATAARVNKYDGTTVFTANNVFYIFSGIYEYQ